MTVVAVIGYGVVIGYHLSAAVRASKEIHLLAVRLALSSLLFCRLSGACVHQLRLVKLGQTELASKFLFFRIEAKTRPAAGALVGYGILC